MPREIKKPSKIRELDLKDYAGDVIIDVSPREKPVAKEKAATLAKDALAESVAVQAAKVATEPGLKLLSFNAWFQKASSKNPRLKLSYKEAVEAHCKAVGLTGPATEEAFDAALKHFGL